jgi:Ion channel
LKRFAKLRNLVAHDKGQVMAENKPMMPQCEGWQQFYRERRFGVLLVILVVLLAGSSVLVDFGLSAEWFGESMSLVILAAILSLCIDRRQRLFALLLGIPTILFSWGGHVLPGMSSHWAILLGHLCGVLFLLGAAGLIVKSLFQSSSLTFDSILGAMCGYLFLGLAWTACYSMIQSFEPGSFYISQSLRDSDGHPQPNLLTYYSFVTLTTVGYGDVIPISPTTRTLAWMEAITGQFYLAIIVAGLVSMFVTNASQRR